VALIDHTYERVGNKGSAKDGHFGVTGWLKKHVSFGPKGATIKYVGKSGVEHEKKVTDPAIKNALKNAYEACDDDGDNLFSWDGGSVTSEKVNEYLDAFDITAKDLRGFHANREMQERLTAVRKKRKKLPEDKKAREKMLKTEFLKALDETAEAVGHEASTLRSQYLVPGLEDTFLKDGTVLSKLGSLLDETIERRVAARFSCSLF
jgi:DNA topoisomerase-1